MKIINSKDKAMNSKHWHDPGAKLYDAIKDSESALEEAYLIVGDTGKDVPYSRSGCKYPHHSINDDGDLVVNIDGVIAAYGRAKQMGIFKGEVKSHLMRHYKELGLYKGSKMEKDETITENFNRIEEFLGIDESKYMTESYDDSSIEELASWIDDIAHNGFPAFTENTFREISFEFEEKGISSPQKLLEWMDCIEYDNSIRDWHLRSVGETYFDKKGNCHDQSLFELIALGEMEYPCGQMFFLEVNEGQTVGGNTHTLTWYIDNNNYYWFEHSWENKRGIHGPYQSIDELKKDVHNEWKTDDDINQGEFERIEFFEHPNYKIGMTLGEYVESWTADESYDESDDESKLDENFIKKDITDIEYDVIDYNDNHDLCEDYFRKYNIFTTEEAIIYNREKKNGEIIIDKSNDSLIGLVLVFASDGTLTPLKVMPEYRGYGFSNILMRDAVDKYGAKYLGVYADNEVAVELYKKFGFEVYKTKEDENGTLLFMRRADLFDESTDIMDMFTEADENDPPELTDENQEDSKPEESSEVPNPDEIPTPPEETSTEQPAEEQPSEEPTEEEPSEGPPSVEEEPAETEEQPEAPKEEPEKPMSMPKQTDAAEKGKNGVRRKKLYIAFIEWCKAYNSKNTFGSIFDKDIFHNVYPFVPEELRYFYRLANPILCVLGGELTFFQVSELRKVNKNNKDLDKQLIFAATQQDLRVFNNEDKKVYLATEENGSIKLGQVLGDTFDTYIQNMIKQGDILNAPLEGEEVEE